MMRSLRIPYLSKKTHIFRFNKEVSNLLLIFKDCSDIEFWRLTANMLNDNLEFVIEIPKTVTENQIINDWHNDQHKFWELWIDDELIERGLLYIDKGAEKYSLPLDFEL